ncbi:hypothetical protein OAK05_08155 [Gammaproteobacteria bacterium]|nr:hypothetical protein [Gammaproteobacteria bacterium]
MKKLLITLLLISPFSFADWGDVYYCEAITHFNTDLEGKRTDFKLEKFKFKLDQAKKAMVFGGTGTFKDAEILFPHDVEPRGMWIVNNMNSGFFVLNRRFAYSHAGLHGVTAIIATCDKF